MGKNNLPQIKKENIFNKIYIKIITLFGKRKDGKAENVNEEIKEKSSFKDNIKIEINDRILYLQQRLKNNEIDVSALSNQELDDLIILYKKQIENKVNKLKKYKLAM